MKPKCSVKEMTLSDHKSHLFDAASILGNTANQILEALDQGLIVARDDDPKMRIRIKSWQDAVDQAHELAQNSLFGLPERTWH